MGLFVVGMHRSGTSATTAALATLPFELPDESELVGGNDSNPLGHFEVLSLMEFNQDLLERAGASWFGPTKAALGSLAELTDPTFGLEGKARQLFRDVFATDHWLFKDPRLSLTLPFWRKVLPEPQAAVLVRRDPIGIAQSLRERNGLGLRHGLALWERYLRTVLAGLDGLPVFVIEFDDVLAGGAERDRLIDFAFDVLGDAAPTSRKGVAKAFAAPLDGRLRHHEAAAEADLELLSSGQQALLEALAGQAGAHESFAAPKMGRETPGLDLMFESVVALDAQRERDVEKAIEIGRDDILGQWKESETTYEGQLDEARAYIDELTDQIRLVQRDITVNREAAERRFDEQQAAATEILERERSEFQAAIERERAEHATAFAEVEAHRDLIEAQRAEAEENAAKQLDSIRSEADATERDHLVEIDYLRDVLATTEAAFAHEPSLRARIIELEQELATAIHQRNRESIEKGELLARPAVKWSLRIANRLVSGRQQIADRVESEPEQPAPTAVDAAPAPAPVGPAEVDYPYLRQRVRDGVFSRPLTVIVPIYNAVDDVERCLEALDRHTPVEVNIVLIDDASTDRRMPVVLDQLRDRPGTTIERNDENLGFTRTVNRGLALAAEGDVIILNSDTMVTPRWSWRLRVAANERPMIATVTPLSDHAGVFSFAVDEPTGLDHAASLGAAVARGARFFRPTSPTGNGFCLFVSQEARAEVGELDHEGFPRGYGEENDFCMKLGAAGFEHVIADDTVVFHSESASFGNRQREKLIAKGLKVLAERYPDYDRQAQEFVASAPFQKAKEVAAASVAGVGRGHRARVLYVLHSGGGGTEFFARDLADSVSHEYESYLLRPIDTQLELWRHAGDEWQLEQTWEVGRGWDPRRFRDPTAAAIALEVLTRWDIEQVHIQHLIGLTLDWPELAAGLGIPLVMSLHDFYLVCPSVNLLDDNVQFCGGTCTPGEGRCQVPTYLPADLPLKHRFVHLWRHETAELMRTVPLFVTPSADTRSQYINVFGDEVADHVRVIEHGLRIDRPRIAAKCPGNSEPIRLLLVGGINKSKGAMMAAELARLGEAVGVSVEILGEVEPGFEHGVITHGGYQRDELADRLRQIRPTFVGIFSVWPETHCYVLSEAWANGIPAVVGPLGAPAERIEQHGGGIVVDQLDPELIIGQVLENGRDRAAYARLARTARMANVRTPAAMADDWMALYREQHQAVLGRTR